MRAGAPFRRRTALSFLSLTSTVTRATSLATTPSAHQKPFTTKAGLDAALAGAADGDYIYYNNSTKLSISTTGTGNAYVISGLSPATNITIDLGTAASIWNPGAVSNGYVEFNYAGTSNAHALFMHDLTNVTIYGGAVAGANGGTGAVLYGNTNNLTWLDGYIHDVGGGGMQLAGIVPAGSASTIQNCTIRLEVNHWSLHPAFDSHNDKGTGFHGIICHGGTGAIKNNTFMLYAHDPLAPGEVVNGVTYPEGGGGSAIEFGQSPAGSGNNNDNLVCYVKAANLLMRPTGSTGGGNPGSTGTGQTAGNVVNLWGNVPLNGLDMVWIEGNNCTGAMVNGTPTGGYFPGSPAIKVEHGRGTNMNQFTGGGNSSEEYVSGKGIVYTDCT